MKTLLHYLKPYKWLVVLGLSLAAINIGFSLIDPILFGKIIKLAETEDDRQRLAKRTDDNCRTDFLVLDHHYPRPPVG